MTDPFHLWPWVGVTVEAMAVVDFGTGLVQSVVELDLVLVVLSQPAVSAVLVWFAWSEEAVEICPALFLLYQTAVELRLAPLAQAPAGTLLDLKSTVWVLFLV